MLLPKYAIRRLFTFTLKWKPALSSAGSQALDTPARRLYCELLESQGRGKTVKIAVSSLRIDAIAAAGLGISRQKIWEASLDGLLLNNGIVVKKKSTNVKEGDVIEVDTLLRRREEEEEEEEEEAEDAPVVMKKGRVEVVEIGERTRKGGYHVTLTRFKHFRTIQGTKNLS